MCEECCSFCKRILWHFTKAQEDGYSWHLRPLLSSKEMGTSHSKLPTEQESWILWNLHFNSYSTQKCQEPLLYKTTQWKKRKRWSGGIWRESDSGENCWAAEFPWSNIIQKFLLYTLAFLHQLRQTVRSYLPSAVMKNYSKTSALIQMGRFIGLRNMTLWVFICQICNANPFPKFCIILPFYTELKTIWMWRFFHCTFTVRRRVQC